MSGSFPIIRHRIIILKRAWIPFFLLLLYLFRLIIINQLALAPDEAYYWYWSKHLDWSYLDHPPMVAYIMALFTHLGSDSEFFVRIGGLLCSVLSLVFLFLTARRLFSHDNRLCWELLFVVNITLLFAAGSIVQTPDTPMVLFWALAVFCGIRILTGSSARWWYLWGVSLGLGLLSKYTMILIVPCQFAYLFLSRSHRHWLLRREPYIALMLGLIIFSPVLLWNWQHHWVSFAFQLHKGFSSNERAIKLVKYVAGQAGVITPLLFLSFLYYNVTGCYLALKMKNSAYLYLIFLSWPVLLFFGFSSMHGKVAEPNWPAPAYISGLMLMWVVYRQRFREKRKHRTFMRIAVSLAAAINLLLYLHLLTPIIPLPPDADPVKQFQGWRELGRKIHFYIEKHPHQKGYFLVSDRGTTVAQAVFYSGNRYMGINLLHPEKYSFLPDREKLRGKNAIILLHRFNVFNLGRYRPYFNEVIPIGGHAYVYKGEKIWDLSVLIFLGKGYGESPIPF